jgi:hypothetical protein
MREKKKVETGRRNIEMRHTKGKKTRLQMKTKMLLREKREQTKKHLSERNDFQVQ